MPRSRLTEGWKKGWVKLGRGQTRFSESQMSAVKPAPPPTINRPVETTFFRGHYITYISTGHISGKQSETAAAVSKVILYNTDHKFHNATVKLRVTLTTFN